MTKDITAKQRNHRKNLGGADYRKMRDCSFQTSWPVFGVRWQILTNKDRALTPDFHRMIGFLIAWRSFVVVRIYVGLFFPHRHTCSAIFIQSLMTLKLPERTKVINAERVWRETGNSSRISVQYRASLLDTHLEEAMLTKINTKNITAQIFSSLAILEGSERCRLRSCIPFISWDASRDEGLCPRRAARWYAAWVTSRCIAAGSCRPMVNVTRNGHDSSWFHDLHPKRALPRELTSKIERIRLSEDFRKLDRTGIIGQISDEGKANSGEWTRPAHSRWRTVNVALECASGNWCGIF